MAEGILQRELLVHSMVCKRKSPHGSQILPFFLLILQKKSVCAAASLALLAKLSLCAAPFYLREHIPSIQKKRKFRSIVEGPLSIRMLANLQGTLQELPKKKEIGTFLSRAIYSGVRVEKIVDRHSNFWPYFSGKVSSLLHRYWICQIISNFKVSFSFS